MNIINIPSQTLAVEPDLEFKRAVLGLDAGDLATATSAALAR